MKHCFVFSLTILFVSCSTRTSSPSKAEYPLLYVQQMTGYEENGEVKKRDSLYTIDSEYFDVGLYSAGPKHLAEKRIEEPRVGVPFHSVTLFVVDSLGESIKFDSSTDFLNFMAKHGYEMVTSNQKKYNIDYTFKRKETK